MKTRSAPLTALWLVFSPIAAIAQGVVPTLTVQPIPAINETDRSGTITLGGLAQTLASANSLRQGFEFQNQSSDDIWINTLGTASATQPSERIPSGAYWKMPGRFLGAISIYGATTGDAYYAKEW